MRRKHQKMCVVFMILVLNLLLFGCGTAGSNETTAPPITKPILQTEATQPTVETIPLGAAKVPILMYHHITEEYQANAVSVSRFAEQMQALEQAGFTAVTFAQLMDFVAFGTALPEKPVVITFDDGYESNLTLAGPVLREYGMNATVFVIGVSIGKDTYKDTGVSMIPHFSLEESLEWSDVIWIESHGYDVHQVAGRDPEPIRQGVLQMEGEDDAVFAELLAADCKQMQNLFRAAFDRDPQIFAYPYGMFSDFSDQILRQQGICVTLTTRPFINVLLPGDPDCLMRMGRYSMNEEFTPELLIHVLTYGTVPTPESAPGETQPQ